MMIKASETLSTLRSLMRNLPNNLGSIQAYIIPTDDAHQSEYICDRDKRRAFICGFDGSSGSCVVTEDEALLWTDGRYYLQASKQLNENWKLMKDGLPTTLTLDAYLCKNLKKGSKVGVDPNLLSARNWLPLANSLKQHGCSLVGIEENLIDLVWAEKQPKAPQNKIIPLGLEHCGKKIGDKVKEIRAQMTENCCSVLVVSALDEIAWLMNLRGNDIDYNPVFFSYCLVMMDEIILFVDENKLSKEVFEHFKTNEVEVSIQPYNAIKPTLKEKAQNCEGKVWISLGSSQGLTSLICETKLHQEKTPISVMKAIKNDTEIAGMKNCHIRDGVALCQYFAWLEKELEENRKVDEISGADKLQELRSVQDKFVGLSFPTISSSGPNGAIIHYNPTPESKRPITKDELYLCDSGAQYLDGTTDVTRTLHFGVPTEFEKECFTRVLKGQIALGTAIFPTKTKGQFLDTIARKPLWDVGLNYAHGTGHGVGHFLNVHEGPIGIGVRPMPDDCGLQENMVLSNEPGYYEDGQFGIRLENICCVKPFNSKWFKSQGALTFETITMCPIQTKMIKKNLLTEKEIQVLNEYHKQVFDTLEPLLKDVGDELTLKWLARETKSI
ncbi:xaa-Pro aminopeptidase ApepP [Culicoides brevitarsis]|uniref:xaa-Pro aminopeptidase ApepP n=1 Tax=Culicoides brevitarsis TaxID=469753 RepID=UPI00307C8151